MVSRRAYLKNMRACPHPWDGITNFPTRVNNLTFHQIQLLGQYYTRTELPNAKCLETIARLRREEELRSIAAWYVKAAQILGELAVERPNYHPPGAKVIQAVPFGFEYPDTPRKKRRWRPKPPLYLEGIWDYL